MTILAKSSDLGQMKSLDADAYHLTLRISLQAGARHQPVLGLDGLVLDMAVSRLFWSGLGLPGCMRPATFKLEKIWPRDRSQRLGNGRGIHGGRFSGPGDHSGPISDRF